VSRASIRVFSVWNTIIYCHYKGQRSGPCDNACTEGTADKAPTAWRSQIIPKARGTLSTA